MYYSAKSARERPEAAEAMGAAHRDLCSTCNHAPACSNRGTPDSPVFFCEEFDAGEAESSAAPAAVAPSQDSTEPKSEYLGLCANCAERETCKLPKPEGGVWYCEEYK